MPIHELEQHPFLDYWKTEADSQREYSGLIIGSFPVHSCTRNESANTKFFYWSEYSHFWRYCSSAFDEEDPSSLAIEGVDNLARRKTIEFLNRHNLLITDVIRCTNRENEESEDKYLLTTKGAPQSIVDNFALNNEIIEMIEHYPLIENLFFTATGIAAKSPFGWFQTIWGSMLKIEEEKNLGKICTINGRILRAFLLPTPKPRGVHFSDKRKNSMFVNYLISKVPNFYHEIKDVQQNKRTNSQKKTLTAERTNFIIETYKQAFKENNLDFDGTL